MAGPTLGRTLSTILGHEMMLEVILSMITLDMILTKAKIETRHETISYRDMTNI